MPLFKTIPIQDGLIGIWHLTEGPEDLYVSFSDLELADPDYLKCTFAKRKLEWLATRLLLRQMIGTDFQISYTATGKPLIDHPKYKYLSISHAQEFVAVFVHQNLNVGLDIEKQTRNYTAIEKRYLSDSEINDAAQNSFIQCAYWCAKEAVFKLVPEEGISFRDQIRIFPFNYGTESQFKIHFISGNRIKEITAFLFSFSEHCLVWVTD